MTVCSSFVSHNGKDIILINSFKNKHSKFNGKKLKNVVVLLFLAQKVYQNMLFFFKSRSYNLYILTILLGDAMNE